MFSLQIASDGASDEIFSERSQNACFYFFDPGNIDVAKNKYGILESILGKRRIKISRISKVNDPLDFQPSFSEAASAEYIEGFRQKWAGIDGKIGTISFSTDIFNILMWSHYAKRHQGFALELELNSKQLTQVNYSLFAPEVIRESKDSPNYKKAINSILRTKALDWAYEKEWRLILTYSKDKNIQEKPADNGEIVRYYLLPEGSIRSIFMGLRCTMEQEQLKAKLNGWGLGTTSIYKMKQDRTGYSLVCPEYEKTQGIQQLINSFRKK